MERYKVTLNKEEYDQLHAIINKGVHSSQKFRNSYILLNTDEGEFSEKIVNKKISEVLKVGMRTIDRVKKKFVEDGLEGVLERNTGTRVYEKKADGDFEAHLISIACSESPEGFARWSLRLLSEKMVELKYVESVSHETIRKVLKKTNLNLGK
jgi:transposase